MIERHPILCRDCEERIKALGENYYNLLHTICHTHLNGGLCAYNDIYSQRSLMLAIRFLERERLCVTTDSPYEHGYIYIKPSPSKRDRNFFCWCVRK